MSAIVTITFNPALDKSTSIAELIPDKKLKCTRPVCEPGGGGINVARAIKKLGGEAIAVYPAGGEAGENITRLLTEETVSTLAIPIKNHTRENLVIADQTHQKQYLFDMPGPSVSKQELEQCLNAIAGIHDVAFMVVSGSLPPGVPPHVFETISSIARTKNAKLIVDTSGDALKDAIKAGVYLIKPNLTELALLAGKDKLNSASIGHAATEMIAYGKCEVIVVSLGGLGAILVTKDLEMSLTPPALATKSTVGAGDSMLAGIVLGLMKNTSLADAVRYGVACGSAATLRPGTELCTKKDADDLYSKIVIKNIREYHVS
ncbi:phosphofructokinase [Mucilaginibacter sp. PPCGB 2223]|uniref:1-phosphofructokinase family hexose kinase n=1 Tax=Mucilaginibacter sp. PPCGB 2223 TaxID=1886027 RepID=UPI000826ABCD|nr:1-phosphofructokinase family hexose kinase [Mucilaginibacter sp. PPCGB 2223]OCX54013.1 phosphofructokinase [Mucilaginibacter sp. PPCGB 2223]